MKILCGSADQALMEGRKLVSEMHILKSTGAVLERNVLGKLEPILTFSSELNVSVLALAAALNLSI